MGSQTSVDKSPADRRSLKLLLRHSLEQCGVRSQGSFLATSELKLGSTPYAVSKNKWKRFRCQNKNDRHSKISEIPDIYVLTGIAPRCGGEKPLYRNDHIKHRACERLSRYWMG